MSGSIAARPLGSLVFRDLEYLELPDGRRIRVLRVVGRGEFGSVYLGELGLRYVVIKILKSAYLQSACEADFLAECDLHQSLQHPNIVSFLCAGRRPASAHLHGNEPYCILDYAGDRTLRHIVDLVREDLVTPYELVAVAQEIAGAVAYLHERELAHFDIKPENILVDSTGRALLGDLGLARHVSHPDFAHGKGTPAYTAPEAFSNQMTFASDVWSFGVLLYELFCHGTLPFAPMGTLTLQEVVLRGVPAPIPARFGVSSVISSFFLSLLVIEPSDRPTMASVLEQLQALPSDLNAASSETMSPCGVMDSAKVSHEDLSSALSTRIVSPATVVPSTSPPGTLNTLSLVHDLPRSRSPGPFARSMSPLGGRRPSEPFARDDSPIGSRRPSEPVGIPTAATAYARAYSLPAGANMFIISPTNGGSEDRTMPDGVEGADSQPGDPGELLRNLHRIARGNS